MRLFLNFNSGYKKYSLKYLINTVFFICLFTISVLGQNKFSSKTDTSKTKGLKTDSYGALLASKLESFPIENLNIKDFQLFEKAEHLDTIGEIDTSDLKLTKCDFEKNANAMVLSDFAVMFCGIPDLMDVKIARHKRIKIFNDNGKDEANIKLEFESNFGFEKIYGIKAETINMVNNNIEVTKLDPQLIYTTRSGKNRETITFTMPNIKPGSVIDYTYFYERHLVTDIPEWLFQCDIPTRYSEVNIILNPRIKVTTLKRKTLPFEKDNLILSNMAHIWAMKNVPSAVDEPYMRSAVDGLQSIKLLISEIRYYLFIRSTISSWTNVGREITEYPEFSKLFDQKLADEDLLIKKTTEFDTYREKVAFLFNQVKANMRWNESENWLSKDGIKAAWKNKTGNCGEINMILYHLLKQSNITAYPMVVSTRENGQLIPNFPDIYRINKLIVYVPIDSASYFILDATDKFNTYNKIPYSLLNGYGLILDIVNKKYDLLFIKNDQPSEQSVFINADIKPDGNMNGTASIASYSYHKSKYLELYKRLNEKKYLEYLANNDNDLKIKSLKMENLEVDSLPLVQNVEFNLELPGTDGKYIYFNPNLFTTLHSNPFLAKARVSDIDFGYNKNYKIIGKYTIPMGYKIESFPQSINLTMEDKTISFKRLVVVVDGLIQVSYNISFKKSFYAQAEYQGIYDYFKKLDETLNEPIVLKKQ